MAPVTKTFTEQWDEIAKESVDRQYRDLGVQPGDHLGAYLKLIERHEAIFAKLPGSTNMFDFSQEKKP